MRSIQDVGLEIMNGNPQNFYIFCGVEYGIKLRYIDMLLKVYPNKIEYNTVEAAIRFFETKQLIPPEPSVYIIRYDQEFLKSLDNNTAHRISKCKIRGCVVCIYQDDKATSKLAKYLPDYTVSIDSVSTNFVNKYLHADFPNCPDRLINLSIELSTDYFQAQSICRAMQCVPLEELYSYSDDQIKHLFGDSSSSDEKAIKIGIASRNFAYTIKLIDKYSGDKGTLLYTILSVMIELEKLQTSSYSQSILSDYQKRWSRADIYNMFMQTYSYLVKSRMLSVDAYDALIYLISLTQFEVIPAVEVM